MCRASVAFRPSDQISRLSRLVLGQALPYTCCHLRFSGGAQVFQIVCVFLFSQLAFVALSTLVLAVPLAVALPVVRSGWVMAIRLLDFATFRPGKPWFIRPGYTLWSFVDTFFLEASLQELIKVAVVYKAFSKKLIQRPRDVVVYSAVASCVIAVVGCPKLSPTLKSELLGGATSRPTPNKIFHLLRLVVQVDVALQASKVILSLRDMPKVVVVPGPSGAGAQSAVSLQDHRTGVVWAFILYHSGFVVPMQLATGAISACLMAPREFGDRKVSFLRVSLLSGLAETVLLHDGGNLFCVSRRVTSKLPPEVSHSTRQVLFTVGPPPCLSVLQIISWPILLHGCPIFASQILRRTFSVSVETRHAPRRRECVSSKTTCFLLFRLSLQIYLTMKHSKFYTALTQKRWIPKCCSG